MASVKQVSKKDKIRAIRDLNRGVSAAEIAKRVGRHHDTIYKWRSPGPKASAPLLSKRAKIRVVRELNKGACAAALAKRLGRHPDTIYRWRSEVRSWDAASKRKRKAKASLQTSAKQAKQGRDKLTLSEPQTWLGLDMRTKLLEQRLEKLEEQLQMGTFF